MDWFSWLSRTSLEPSLIYEYSLAFSRNELQLEDANYFNHEFLQSMGISIAKHRLEILKLVKKEDGANLSTKKLSGIIKKCLRKYFGKLVFHEEVKDMPPEPNWYQGKWRGALVRKHGTEEIKREKGVNRRRTIAFSGPLDGRMHEKVFSSKVLKLSGPIDGKVNERMMCTNRSPVITRPVEGRFLETVKSPKLCDARGMVNNNNNNRITSPWIERAELESPMGHSPFNKIKADSDTDDDYALWPTLFEDLKPN